MENQESVLGSETHKIRRDFEMQTNHRIPARRPDGQQKKKGKENLPNNGLAVLTNHRVKLKDKYLDLGRELKSVWKMKVTVIPIVIIVLRTIPKGLVKELENLEIRGQVKTV